MTKRQSRQYNYFPGLHVFCSIAALFMLGSAGPCLAGEPAAVNARNYNIVMLVVDCLRADHLSLYGYHRPTSPNIDAFAGEAAVFEQTTAQSDTTLLSFASIFTSMNVSAHGVDTLEKALSNSALTLAEILKIYNYSTGAFMAGPNLNPNYRLTQGFDTYSHIDRIDASFKDTLPAALKWATEKNAGNEKFFLVAHGNDIHTPYLFPPSNLYTKAIDELSFPADSWVWRFAPPAHRLLTTNFWPFYAGTGVSSREPGRHPMPLPGRPLPFPAAPVINNKHGLPPEKSPKGAALAAARSYIAARYDEGINYTDGLIGNFLEELRTKSLLDQTIVILTADHGEGLFDHTDRDYYFHEDNLYQDTLRVPLIIKVPGLSGRHIAHPVQLIDLMPTVLELAGIAPPGLAQGNSLVPLLTGAGPAPADRDIFSKSRFSGDVIQDGKMKLILFPDSAELYNLHSDPGETVNLSGSEQKTEFALKTKLFARLAADKHTAPDQPPAAPEIIAADLLWYAACMKTAQVSQWGLCAIPPCLRAAAGR